MKQSVSKLVDVILKRIEENPEALESETGMRTWLTREGYAKRDIDAAMQVVRPRMIEPRRPAGYLIKPVRTLNLFEEYKMTPEAREALVRLDMYDLIDADERELILERLNHFDGVVGLEELDYLLAWLVCSMRDVESQQTIFNTLDGGAIVYH